MNAAVVLLVAVPILFNAAFAELGRTFSYPDVLRRPAAEVMQRVHAAGYAVGNADCTLIAEAPRVAPHVPAMRRTLAPLLGVDETAVNVKATTNEKMGHIGRREGMAAHAVVVLVRG